VVDLCQRFLETTGNFRQFMKTTSKEYFLAVFNRRQTFPTAVFPMVIITIGKHLPTVFQLFPAIFLPPEKVECLVVK